MGCSSSSVNISKYTFGEFDDGPDTEERTFDTFRNKANTHTLYYRFWKPLKAKPVALMIGFHGILEHSGKYALLAHEFTKAGIAAAFIDHQGHGKTEGGPRGDFRTMNGLVEDGYELLTTKLIPAYPDLPVFIFGHSMGSLVCSLLAHKLMTDPIKDKIAGFITSGMALHPGNGSFRPLGFKCLYCLEGTSLARCLANTLKIAQPLGLSSPVQEDMCIKDPERRKQNHDDPLMIHTWVLNRAGANTLMALTTVANNAKDITFPYLAIHGDEDQVTLPDGSTRHMDALTNCKDKTYHIAPGGYHEVFYDKVFEPHAAFMIDWILNHSNNGKGLNVKTI